MVDRYDAQKNILTPSQRAKATPNYCLLLRQDSGVSFTFGLKMVDFDFK